MVCALARVTFIAWVVSRGYRDFARGWASIFAIATSGASQVNEHHACGLQNAATRAHRARKWLVDNAPSAALRVNQED